MLFAKSIRFLLRDTITDRVIQIIKYDNILTIRAVITGIHFCRLFTVYVVFSFIVYCIR